MAPIKRLTKGMRKKAEIFFLNILYEIRSLRK